MMRQRAVTATQTEIRKEGATMQITRLRLRNGHVYDVREDYKTTLVRLRELDWIEYRDARTNGRVTVRSMDVSAVELVETNQNAL
jgi:hypothetical protein